ncbi:hypothetical protein DERP_001603 [Dermatophagoides pteronyssinus]|uniref:Uncharacterized protein n=1 Tax=Dermatophagoides pteronyssinus TaxID=6956 RepID=A0ABQ8JBK5_DERPT|nr:hypothetical protein DERP_001603 [Dermatophagoides pteronyssinus]
MHLENLFLSSNQIDTSDTSLLIFDEIMGKQDENVEQKSAIESNIILIDDDDRNNNNNNNNNMINN